MNDDQTTNALRAELVATRAQLAQALAERDALAATTRHLNFLDNAEDGFLFTDETGALRFVNQFALRMLGYEANERHLLMGAPLPPAHWRNPRDQGLIERALEQQGSIRDHKVELLNREVQPVPVTLSAVLTRDMAGRPTGTQTMLRPLLESGRRGTAELRAENRELAALTAIGRAVLSTMQLEEVLQHLMQTVLDLFEMELAWVYLKDRSGRIRLVGSIGLDAHERQNVATAVDDFFGFRQAMETGRPRLFGSRSPMPERLIVARRLEMDTVALAPLRGHDEPVGLLVIANRAPALLVEADLQTLERIAQYAGLALSNATLYDDLQLAYEELKRAQARLVEAERQKVAVEMAGAAAHELNQPLTVLLGYSNLLARLMKDDDPQKPVLEKIERSTRKISEVVARLGQITRYRTREYIEGQPIVDIEAASRREDGER